jgi:hypothetical protein
MFDFESFLVQCSCSMLTDTHQYTPAYWAHLFYELNKLECLSIAKLSSLV